MPIIGTITSALIGKGVAAGYDEVSGARKSREEQAETLKKLDKEQKAKIAADNQRIADEELRKKRVEDSKFEAAQINAAAMKKRVSGEGSASTGRRSTFLTSPLGISQPYQGARRTLLGA